MLPTIGACALQATHRRPREGELLSVQAAQPHSLGHRNRHEARTSATQILRGAVHAQHLRWYDCCEGFRSRGEVTWLADFYADSGNRKVIIN
jgi:hypothetical protein